MAKYFGAIPRPARALPALYTREPTQDGERNVTLRRAGDSQMVMTLYRVPAGSHPEYPAIDVLAQVLGDAPSGRLHRMLVQKGLAGIRTQLDKAVGKGKLKAEDAWSSRYIGDWVIGEWVIGVGDWQIGDWGDWVIG